MGWRPASAFAWLFDTQQGLPIYGAPQCLIPRWLFLRALGLIYFSAFFSLVFQIRGLIGPVGILPASTYLQNVARSLGSLERVWYAPTLLWFSSSSSMLSALCWVGMVASLLVVLNFWPRCTLAVCFVCFLSFVSAAQDFSGYQSDGMLLEAGFLSLFFAPSGVRPGLGVAHPASRASLFLLRWEWFRIYFESGVVKLLSGDPQWRHFTAMDEYYQNGPLPTWVGWYVQHLPHWFHAGTVWATLALELGLVWMLFLPRRWKIACFLIVTPWEIGVILTANYTFLNYLVLSLGVLLLDDRFVAGIIPAKWRTRLRLPETTVNPAIAPPSESVTLSILPSSISPPGAAESSNADGAGNSEEGGIPNDWRTRSRWSVLKVSATSVILLLIFYVTTAQMLTGFPLPVAPIIALEPFRIANRYGLFAIMTRGRYEVEFQGSNDGQNWIPYPFRYKPQELNQAPRIYAPYQPRFDWNLWFASLGAWQEYPIVPNTEVRLLSNDRDVLQLFAGNPFGNEPPRQIRVLLWQYWFTTMAEKRSTGKWWRRQLLGLYGPTIERTSNGEINVIEESNVAPRE